MKWFHQHYLILLTIFLLSAVSCNNYFPDDKPNIILIYTDDLGKGLLSHEGQQIIKTPNIDRLALEGIRFQNAYSAMFCAPARASMITGLHDCHAPNFEITNAGIYKTIEEKKRSLEEVEEMIHHVLSSVPAKQVFLAELAKKAGYKTAQFGKLEWGFATTRQQLIRHGWDSYFGYMDHVRAHGFYPPYLVGNSGIIKIKGNTLSNCGKSGEPETQDNFIERWNMTGKAQYSQQVFVDSILNFMETNKENPFFLYFPTQLPHGPVSIPSVHSDFKNDDRLSAIEKEYASMVKMLDDHVGLVLHKIEELNIDDNTIVIFTSDNGHEIYYAQEGRIQKPYADMNTGKVFDNLRNKYYSNLAGDVFNGNAGRAGLKRSNLQGGIEVPLIIRWPEKIKPGSVSQLLVANYDMLPTLADIVNNKTELDTDGISFFNEIMGLEIKNMHEYIVYSSFHGPTLITNDGWKIRTFLKENVYELFYLPEDFREEKDLSTTFPDKLNELKEKLTIACDGNLLNGLYSPGNQINIE